MKKTVSLEELSYCPDSCLVFEKLRNLPDAVFLDSAFPYCKTGRFDIMVADPSPTPVQPLASASDKAWHSYYSDLSHFHRQHFGTVQPVSQDIPFCGGILGAIGYDNSNLLHKVRNTPPATPYSGFLLRAYEWAVIQDHLLQRSVLVTQPSVTNRDRQEILARLRAHPRRDNGFFNLREHFRSNFTEEAYREAFTHIQDYIHAGDCYQVNLAQRFVAAFDGDPWLAYLTLREAAAAPFSAFLSLHDEDALISLSPERFLSLHGQHVQTAPIKGTRPRHQDPVADERAANELQASIKDRAENLMIVDLLRNDLGRNCIPGTIHVDELFEIQSFPTVHHMVSNISGELKPDSTAYELLRDSFPGGSITGAPKRRAMEIIAELEPHAREFYCGSVLYISADGRMDSNIAIRSLLATQGELRCWGGGGIVADSQWQQEYQETYDKVGGFLQLLEAMV